MKYLRFFLPALIVILVDQTVKMLIHNNMDMGDIGEISVFGNWFKLHYTLNPGMAFGITFDSTYGKLSLTLFRMLASVGIGIYLYKLVQHHVHKGFIACISLILGGAVGNLVDSIFYGVLLENAPFMETPPGVYPWFHGQVIDMFYLDIWKGYVPENIPLLGGHYYALWPIFNVADSAIFIGVTCIILFQGKFFPKQEPQTTATPAVADMPAMNQQETTNQTEETTRS